MTSRVLIVSDKLEQMKKLSSDLAERGLDCSVVSFENLQGQNGGRQVADLVLLTMNGSPNCTEVVSQAQKIRRKQHVPIVALITREALNTFDIEAPIDDFIIDPWHASEVIVRLERTIRRAQRTENKRLLEHKGLVVDLDNCEVTVDGRLATLTFKEYELLKFLMTNKGKVFTREALLNEVWGYDFYGGDRTVDVHIRRLRSKIEDPVHTYIETVRNIGYRFSKNA